MLRFSSPRHAFWAVAAAAMTVTLVSVATESKVQAQNTGPFGFQPYGFYQPYGVRYRSRTPTPPYFALNPPVYYGARHYRPYGLSPFAAPPQLSAPASYQGTAAPSSLRQQGLGAPTCNPYISHAGELSEVAKSGASNGGSSQVAKFTPGEVQSNPFVTDTAMIARR